MIIFGSFQNSPFSSFHSQISEPSLISKMVSELHPWSSPPSSCHKTLFPVIFDPPSFLLTHSIISHLWRLAKMEKQSAPFLPPRAPSNKLQWTTVPHPFTFGDISSVSAQAFAPTGVEFIVPFAQEATACLLNAACVLDAKHPKLDEREPVKVETEREEVQCSEWGYCYSSTSSSERDEGIAGFGSPKKAGASAAADEDIFAVVSASELPQPPSPPVIQDPPPTQKIQDARTNDHNHTSSSTYKIPRQVQLLAVLSSQRDDHDLFVVMREKSVVDVATSRIILGQSKDDSVCSALCCMLSEIRPVEIMKPAKGAQNSTTDTYTDIEPARYSNMEKAIQRQRVLLDHLQPNSSNSFRSTYLSASFCAAVNSLQTGESEDVVMIVAAYQTAICKAKHGGFNGNGFCVELDFPVDPVTGTTHCSLASYWSEKVGSEISMFILLQVSRRNSYAQEVFDEMQQKNVVISLLFLFLLIEFFTLFQVDIG